MDRCYPALESATHRRHAEGAVIVDYVANPDSRCAPEPFRDEPLVLTSRSALAPRTSGSRCSRPSTRRYKTGNAGSSSPANARFHRSGGLTFADNGASSTTPMPHQRRCPSTGGQRPITTILDTPSRPTSPAPFSPTRGSYRFDIVVPDRHRADHQRPLLRPASWRRWRNTPACPSTRISMGAQLRRQRRRLVGTELRDPPRSRDRAMFRQPREPIRRAPRPPEDVTALR